MAKIEKNLRDYAAEIEGEKNNEQLCMDAERMIALDEFCDHLEPAQVEMFRQMAELYEQKLRWTKRYTRLQKCILEGDFDTALVVFEELSEDMF